jgi:UDP-N-acetylmuramoylalanine--D-glutamate ligase
MCFRPDIAMLTNITPDHLDRYEYQLDNYIMSKMGLFNMMTTRDRAIYYKEDLLSQKGIQIKPAKASPYWISLEENQNKGGFSDGEQLIINAAQKTAVIPVSGLSIQGKHNILNSLFAGFKTFKNAPHRMELIRTVDGVRFVNDSKGTNVESTYYALGSYTDPMIWIAGGVDKGNDYTVLHDLVKDGKVKALICLGTDNEKLKKAFAGSISEIRETQDIREAVLWSQQLATQGEVVLLSPACASFDLFKNYEDRGEQFRAAVWNLTENQKG